MIAKTYSRFKNAINRLIKIIQKPEMIILPGNLSYSLILSIFPAIMIIGYIISKLHISTNMIFDILSPSVPADALEIILKFLSTGFRGGNIVWTIILALIFSSNGANAIIVTSNILYKNENSDSLKRKVKSFFLVLILLFVFSITIFILGFGSTILKALFGLIDGNYNELYKFFSVVKWPISFFIIFFLVKVLYTLAPDVRIKSRTVTRGALFTTAGWVIVTFIYSIYVSKFARYDVFYGNVSSIIIMMVWVYILSSILVIGIAINADTYILESKAKNK